jgi:hypothetical protein
MDSLGKKISVEESYMQRTLRAVLQLEPGSFLHILNDFSAKFSINQETIFGKSEVIALKLGLQVVFLVCKQVF